MPTIRSGFDPNAGGNPALMHDNGGSFPDDVPVADAVEQQRSTSDSPSGDDDTTDYQDDIEVPLEATDSDWLEQRETVSMEPEYDEPGR
jgi:hypothetical protein